MGIGDEEERFLLEFYRKYARTGLDIGLLALFVFLVLIGVSFLYNIAAPLFFAIAWFILIEPLANRIHRSGVRKGVAAMVSVWFWIIMILVIFSFIFYVFAAQIGHLAQSFPTLGADFIAQLTQLSSDVQIWVAGLDPEWNQKWQDFSAAALKKGNEWFGIIAQSIFGFMQLIPGIFFNALIGLILAYFLSLERESFGKVVKNHTPDGIKDAFRFFHDHVWIGLRRYVRAQMILVSFSFLWLLIGFVVLGVKTALSIAVICAIFDILPIVGVATIILPWALYQFLSGDTYMAIGLLVIYAVVTIFKQIMEPIISGESLGVSAFTMLAGLVLSYSIFGVAGLIATPVLILLFKAISEQGLWKKWIYWPADEEDSAELKQ